MCVAGSPLYSTCVLLLVLWTNSIQIMLNLFGSLASLDPKLSMNSWLSKLEASSWLDYVQSVLSAACYIAQCLDTQGTAEHYTVLFETDKVQLNFRLKVESSTSSLIKYYFV